jgi:hypothetical protein
MKGNDSDTKQINECGSDSARHYKGTAFAQHASTPKAGPAVPNTVNLDSGSVGNGKAVSNDPRSVVKS